MMPEKTNVRVLYMTNGDGATDKKGERLKEALSAIKILGYDKINIIDGDMPFYRSKDRVVSEADYSRFKDILLDFMPNHIFLCKDSDPKKTHDKCAEIVEKVTKEPFEFLRCIWYYMGAWG